MAYGNLYWRVESGCNLRCKMCLRDHNSKISKGYERNLLEEAKSLGFSTIVFTGGEPTLREDLPELIQQCESYGFKIRLDTNGIKLDRDYLKSLGDKIHLGLPLHGSTAKLHDSIVNMDGHFDIIKNRADISRELQIPVKITTAVCRLNISDVENIANYLEKEIHPRIYGVNAVVRGGLPPEDFKKLEISPQEFGVLKSKLQTKKYSFKFSFCGHEDSEHAYVFVNPDFTVNIIHNSAERFLGDLKKDALEIIMQNAPMNFVKHLARAEATSFE